MSILILMSNCCWCHSCMLMNHVLNHFQMFNYIFYMYLI